MVNVAISMPMPHLIHVILHFLVKISVMPVVHQVLLIVLLVNNGHIDVLEEVEEAVILVL